MSNEVCHLYFYACGMYMNMALDFSVNTLKLKLLSDFVVNFRLKKLRHLLVLNLVSNVYILLQTDSSSS